MIMRKLFPNLDRVNGLETVLEVPMPEEMFANEDQGGHKLWHNVSSWFKPQCSLDSSPRASAHRNCELQVLLNVVGSPLIPLPIRMDALNNTVKDTSIEASTAKYIVQQYIAAAGGQAALNSVNSYYAVGKVTIGASDFKMGSTENIHVNSDSEVGGFVLWQMNPDLWYLELVVSGCKVSAGSDGKVAWRQMAAQQSHASKGPPRPLRRALQGLDPRTIASLFSNGVCIGEKVIDGEDCFVLKVEASLSTLQARAGESFEIIHHTIWGYFSQRLGLLVHLEDKHLMRMSMKGAGNLSNSSSSFWETSMESSIQDYRYVDGIRIAHKGHTQVTLFRYGEGSTKHKRKMEETWEIDEVDFNIWGLSMDCFLPPSDLNRDEL